jgi:hypothetical protein
MEPAWERQSHVLTDCVAIMVDSRHISSMRGGALSVILNGIKDEELSFFLYNL